MRTPSLHAAPRRARSRRLAALATAGTLGAGALMAGATSASAAPLTVDDAVIEWDFSQEVGTKAPPFGGCNYLSAGASDGSQASYKSTDGNVSVVRTDGATPEWSNKCAGVGNQFQKVRWTGGTGTVDPATGAATLTFTGQATVNFYGGLVPFTVENPTFTLAAGGDGQLTATLFGWESSMEDPMVKVPVAPVNGVVVANLSDVAVGATGFNVTPDYAGVTYDAPLDGDGEPLGTPQNRTNPGWGAWPTTFVDFHYLTGLTSYWYSSGGAADPYKAPTAISVSYTTTDDGGGEGPVNPGGSQTIVATVPEGGGAGEFLWSIDGDGTVNLGTMADQGTHLQANGSIDPINVVDNRPTRGQWSITGQASSFNGGLSGSHLGWAPKVITAGAGAMPGSVVASSLADAASAGLSTSSVLAAAPGGHAAGSATVGADLDLRLPIETAPGTYTSTLTITALS